MIQNTTPESRTRKYIIWGAVIALLGLSATLLTSGFSGDTHHAIADDDATIRVSCAACGETFDMPFSDYQEQAPLGTDVSGPINCPKCGATASVTRVMSGGMPPVRRERTDANPDVDEPEPEEYDEPPPPGSHVG